MLTSQRIVDVVLKAFHACAASQGCTKYVPRKRESRIALTRAFPVTSRLASEERTRMERPSLVGDITKRSLEVLEQGRAGTGRLVYTPTLQIPESATWKSWNEDIPSCFTGSASDQILEERAGGKEGTVWSGRLK